MQFLDTQITLFCKYFRGKERERENKRREKTASRTNKNSFIHFVYLGLMFPVYVSIA